MAIYKPDVKLKWYQTVFNYLAPLDNSKKTKPGAMGISFSHLLPWITEAAVSHDLNDDAIRAGTIDMTYLENDQEFIAKIRITQAAYPFKNALTRTLGKVAGKCIWPVIRAYRELRGQNLVDKQILAKRAGLVSK